MMLRILLICSFVKLFVCMVCQILLSLIVILNFLATFGDVYGLSWGLNCCLVLICHPQTDGQTEVVNRTLSTMLRAVLKKNLKLWEECLPHIEFAYNRSLHYTTKMCPFEIVYGFVPRAPIDLLPLPSSVQHNLDDTQRAEMILNLHKTTKDNIEHMNAKYKLAGDKGRNHVVFDVGDLVSLHLRKDRFPDLRKSKLMPRAAGPFKVLEKINNNAYKLELPADFGTVSPMFNIADLKPYFGEKMRLRRGRLQFKKGSMMWTSHLLIQPWYLQLHTYKDPSQDLVPNNLTIRYFRFLELFLIYMRI